MFTQIFLTLVINKLIFPAQTLTVLIIDYFDQRDGNYYQVQCIIE